MSIILLVLGFVLLIKGADFFVEGSSQIAKRLGVSPLIIGMTIVAMGTSLPELSVSTTASLAGNNGVAIGNVVGSNMFNLLIVAGLCALIFNLPIDEDTAQRDLPFSILCAVLLLGLSLIGMKLDRFDGIIFLFAFAIFLLLMIKSAKSDEEDDTPPTLSFILCMIYIVGGAVAVKFGGDFVVEGSSEIARAFGMSDNLIGLTIVAFGTSLPELVTSVVAATKHETDLAMGNVIGSNIFNILLILGTASAISPIEFTIENLIDVAVLITVSLVVLFYFKRDAKITKKEGFSMILMYAAYMVYAIMR